MPSHQAGDLIIVFAGCPGANTIPSLPAGYTNLANNTTGGSYSETQAGMRVGYKIAASNSEDTGTWAGAVNITVVVYRGATIRTSAATSGYAALVNYPALSGLAASDWGVRFGQGGGTAATPSGWRRLYGNTNFQTCDLADIGGSSLAASSTGLGGAGNCCCCITVALMDSIPPLPIMQGANQVSALKIGTSDVTRIYRGSSQLWP